MITFEHGGVTYTIVRSSKYTGGHEVQRDGEFVAHFLGCGGEVPEADLIVVAKHAITNKPRRDFEL